MAMKKVITSAFLASTVLAIGFVHIMKENINDNEFKYLNKDIIINEQIPPKSIDVMDFTDFLNFLHKDSFAVCDNILLKKAGENYTKEIELYYDILKKEHSVLVGKLAQIYGRKTCFTGSSKTFPGETYVMMQLARLPFVKTVCETGFNAGFSTHLWLLAKPDIHVYSFDIGTYACAKPVASFLLEKYPGRLTITWGDSQETIPKFISENPIIKCDLMIIDGGHTYNISSSDIKHFRRLARGTKNIVFFDNYPQCNMGNNSSGRHLGHTWEEAIRSGIVAELYRCQYTSYRQGFTFGRFNK